MKRFFPLAVSALVLFVSVPSMAARIGSFNLKVPFADTTRTLSVYAPTTYDSTHAYRLMICLHGLGDNSSNYRNALVASLMWSSNFPNTIFVCPEAQTTTDDFYDGVGGEAIIDTAMAWAMTNYHIDTSNVILQGFSLGGRAALKYGLEHTATLKGLLLNTPALQGVKNALNEQPAYTYDYANAPNIPIYVTHGAEDLFYTAPIDSMIKQLVLNNGKVTYRDIAGMAHDIPSFDKIRDVLSFFNTPSKPGADATVYEVAMPVRLCNLDKAVPSVLVQNTGSTTIQSLDFSYTVNGSSATYTWQAPTALLPFQHALVELPGITVVNGANAITAKSLTVDGAVDTIPELRLANDTFQVQLQPLSLPLSQNFENEDYLQTWADVPAGDLQSDWSIDSTLHTAGSASLFNFNSVFLFDNMGRAEGLLSPVVDLTTIQNPKLHFDYAFNYLEYTPPYFTRTVDLTDTLEVLISTDCGATWTSLFKKWGPELATFSDPIVNPLSVPEGFAVPEDSNWRRVTIDLGPYATAADATIKFNYISGLGGSFNLDNVAIDNTSAVIEAKAPVASLAYPNPATDRLIVPAETGTTITLTDATGNVVRTVRAIGAQALDTHALPPGAYILTTRSSQGVQSQKISIVH